MKSKTKEVGGGPAVGLAGDFTNWLDQGLQTGQFGGASPGSATAGADPYASTRAKLTEMSTGGPGWRRAAAGKALAKLPKVSANPNAGLTGVLNDVLSGGAGKLGGSLQKILETKQAGDVGDLRSRYSMGGTGAGTPAAYAESLYRANAAPQAAMQIGELQLSTLMPLLQMIAGISGKGISQRSTLVEPSTFSQVTTGIGQLASGAGSVMSGAGALRK